MTTSASAEWRTMYDGINTDASVIRGIWKPGDLVGYYVAGNSFIWSASDKALFPPSALVGITLTHLYTGPGSDVLDIETGGALPSEAIGWIAAKKAMGYARPTLYCSLGLVPEIRAVTGAYVLGKDYDLFVAKWDGSTAIPYPHVAVKQDRDAGLYDVSVVYDPTWPHRTPVAPVPVAGRPPLGTQSVRNTFVRVMSHREVYAWNGRELYHVADPAVFAAMKQAGYNPTIFDISPETLSSLGSIIS